MDNDLLLTCEALRLSSSLSRGQTVGEAFTLKCEHTQSYLTVNADQATVLNEFAQSQTVPEVLEVCLRNRTCIPLREYYELVLKAYRAGLLLSEQSVSTRQPAVRWFLSLPAVIIAPIVFLAPVAAIAMLFVRPPIWPSNGLDLVWGWLATCGALSIGQLVAASVLRSARCEVYRPHLRWQAGMPHFAVDLRDICMAGRFERAVVSTTPAAAVAALAATALAIQTPWSTFPLLALFFLCRPVGGGMVRRLLNLFRRKALLDTDIKPLFEYREPVFSRWKSAWRRLDLRGAILQLIYAVIWTAGICHLAYQWLGLDLAEPFQNAEAWEQAGLGVLASYGAIAVCVGLYVGYCLIQPALSATWAKSKLTWQRWRAGKTAPERLLSADALLRRNPLLRRFPGSTLAEIAQSLKVSSFGAWTTVIRFDDEPPQIGVILSGSMTVYRRTKAGRKVRFLRLAESDIFGAHRLIDPENPSLEVRTNTPCIVLTMSSADFQRLVVDNVGAPLVCNYVHKLPFLQSSPLCTHWRAPAIARFIEIAKLAAVPAGTKLITEREEVRSLYVLYEGLTRALHGPKQIGTMKPGEVFGEISLLQCSAASADVETVHDARFFIVDRFDFLRFMSRNHHVALQVERIASQRLGRPVFPLNRLSFDVQ
jgi:CRP-like cAMP-binding protein